MSYFVTQSAGPSYEVRVIANATPILAAPQGVSNRLEQFGAAGNGVTDDTAAVQAAEASDFPNFDLQGKTYLTTLQASVLTKRYYNGSLLVRTIGADEAYRNRAPVNNAEVQTTGRKSPIIDWPGKRVLWLGTSIPRFGFPLAYPQLCASDLGFSVVNNAWAGSGIAFDDLEDIDPDGSIAQVRSLSMTDADRVAGLALYGPGSVFDDDYDAISKATQMTCDFRIAAPWQEGHFDAVMLDHNHNDRAAEAGTLTPETLTITGITKGATTTITLASAGTLAEGDAVAMRVVGIPSLDYAAGRVQSVAGTTITVAVESAALSGTFTSGTLQKLDRTTIYGSFDFVVSFIRNCAVRYGTGTTQIILSGAPSEYTNDNFTNGVWGVNRKIETFAAARGLAFYDIAQDLRIKAEDHLVYLSDEVHPATAAERRVLANHWTRWLAGGAIAVTNPDRYLPNGGTAFADQSLAVFSEVLGGFGPVSQMLTAPTVRLDEDFSGTLGAYTTTGTAPVIEVAPWDAGEFAIKCVPSLAQPNSYIARALSLENAVDLSFDLYLTETVGLTTGLPKTFNLFDLRTTGAYFSVQMIVVEASTAVRAVYFETPNNTLVAPSSVSLPLTAATKHRVRLQLTRATSDGPGGMLLTVDDVVVQSAQTNDAGQAANASFRFGASSANFGATLNVWLGNLLISDRAVAAPVSGTFTTADAKTVTVTNGLVTAIV